MNEELLSEIKLREIVFIDIETVPKYKSYDDVPDDEKKLWKEKKRNEITETTTDESLYAQAGLMAEFGKIICITIGVISEKDKQRKFLTRSYYGDDEKELLLRFQEKILKFQNETNRNFRLCGHNLKGFDLPYIMKRMIINGIAIPQRIDISLKKPWTIKHLDTMEIWKFAMWESTSLNLLAYSLGIPSPKDDISGADVGRVYWEENDLERIRTYCEKDVLTTAQVFLRLRNEEIIMPENVERARDYEKTAEGVNEQ